jgi:hypothetical protein
MWYMLENEDLLIREYLDNPPPTLTSLQHSLKKTNTRLNDMEQKFKVMQDKADAGAQQAAMAKASLAAM